MDVADLFQSATGDTAFTLSVADALTYLGPAVF